MSAEMITESPNSWGWKGRLETILVQPHVNQGNLQQAAQDCM